MKIQEIKDSLSMVPKTKPVLSSYKSGNFMLLKFTVLGKDIHTGEEYTGALCTYDNIQEYEKHQCLVYKDGQPTWFVLEIVEVLEAIQVG